MSTPQSIVIVGAGLAGVSAAGALREQGFAGRIVLLSEEPEMPYDRPPLSKGVLVHDELEKLVEKNLPGDIALHAPKEIALRAPHWYEDKQIELLRGRKAAHVDRAARRVTLDDGETIGYDKLLLAPGARVRRLAAMEAGPVHVLYLRTIADAMDLRSRLVPGARVVLLGGGVIGMEVAASAVLRGCDVTVVEMMPRIMARWLTPTVGEHLAAYHRAKGVKLLLGAGAAGQATAPVAGLALADGTVLPADLIAIGIGVIPNVELAQAAGLRCEDGIVVDACGATSDPDIYAVGDAVRYPDPFFGREMRSENWMHAQNQAVAAAKNMLGANEAYRYVPNVWSDQYDLKIQTAGVCESEDIVVRGSLEGNTCILFHMDGRRIAGTTGINQPRDMKFTHKLIDQRVEVDRTQLADPEFNLKKAAK